VKRSLDVVVTEVRGKNSRDVSNTVMVIESRADEIAFEKQMMEEHGVDESEWFDKTDPHNPPLKVGDKVWIEAMAGGVPSEMISKLRVPQTVEELTPVPCNDVALWSVSLVGIPYIFTQHDLKKA
jgi:hypothetical protein